MPCGTAKLANIECMSFTCNGNACGNTWSIISASFL
uniref:Uncharacterized protein n=1 Tax=Arundo donax TaxID=35708 RepID=A0A0A9BR09_ARUDO